MSIKVPQYAAAVALALEQFDNSELAAFHNAATGFGRLSPGNRAYPRAIAAALCEEDGRIPCLEETIHALFFEVNRRIKAGTFQ